MVGLPPEPSTTSTTTTSTLPPGLFPLLPIFEIPRRTKEKELVKEVAEVADLLFVNLNILLLFSYRGQLTG